MRAYLIVFLGAGLGGALRHAVHVVAVRSLGAGFPWGTLGVNVAGSLLMGVMVGWFAHRADPGQGWRVFLTTGVLGGFTTFSAFSLEVALLWERGAPATAGAYVLASVGLSVAALFLGLMAARHWT